MRLDRSGLSINWTAGQIMSIELKMHAPARYTEEGGDFVDMNGKKYEFQISADGNHNRN